MFSQWLTDDLDFIDKGCALFLVGKKDLLANGFAFSDTHNNETLLQDLTALVLGARQELHGCQVFFFGFEPTLLAWRIGVSHPSLPVYKFLDSVPTESLFRHPYR